MTWEFADVLGRRLVAWGVLSGLVGLLLLMAGDAFWRGFGAIALLWGVADAALGVIARRRVERNRRRTIGDQPLRDLANRVIRRLLVANAVIDVVWLAVGAWLVATAGGDPWRAGAGWGVLVQGAFLLVLDLVHLRWMPPPGPLLPPGLAPYRGPGHEAFALRREDADIAPGPVRGAVLVHGFARSPRELRGLAAVLATDGWLVEVPRLPGHGADLRDIAEYGLEDWVEAVELAATRLRDAGTTRLLVAGTSVGGTLAVVTAARLHPDAIVLLAPFAWPVPRWQRVGAPVLRIVLPPGLRLFSRLDLDDPATRAGVSVLMPGADLDDPAVTAGLRELQVPLSLLERLLRLSALAVEGAPAVHVPVLAIQGTDDRLSRPDRTRRLLAALPSEPELLELPAGSDLVSESSPVREVVLARIRAFAAARATGD